RTTVVLAADNPARRLEISLRGEVLAGKAINVTANRTTESPTAQQIVVRDMDNQPLPFGDVLRSLKILPGVSSNNELSSAYNVRGGNYDENLIYLNGFEVYRPFLLRSGAEENQSFLNPDLVENLTFYSGSFPAHLGERLSSALEARYEYPDTLRWGGKARLNFFGAGLALRHRRSRFAWQGGVRYSNPSLFADRLQTSGDYQPLFRDFQWIGRYRLSEGQDLEAIFILGDNRFDVAPEQWQGHYTTGVLRVSEVAIDYTGNKTYSYRNNLAGVRYRGSWGDWKSSLGVSRFLSREVEKSDLASDIFYIPDAREPNDNRTYLKSRFEDVDNRLELENLDLSPRLSRQWGAHHLTLGMDLRRYQLREQLQENFSEQGDSNAVLLLPAVRDGGQNRDWWTGSAFVRQQFDWQSWQLDLGLRAFHNRANGETLFSPRVSLFYFPHPHHAFHLSGGTYAQPPLFYELRGEETLAEKLKAQLSHHLAGGWQWQVHPTLRIEGEAFYRRLSRLIPYSIKELQLVYRPEEAYQGFAYGWDWQLKGELVPGMQSWIGYGYLKSRERLQGTKNYQRRPLDQTHTLRLFFQDRVPRMPNIQAHLRYLFGSGYLYNQAEFSENAEGQLAVVENDLRREFPAFQRFDLGVSARLQAFHDRQVILTAEVLNVFNHINVAAYEFIYLGPGVPVRIPRIYTRRFFNLAARFHF
ncbi:MAG: TonB-dependent receptor plug domain-containing protein, partial [Calditrichaeota bacterium]|nr:TonB-dependent receptor plug domain-containing protein [Calditrichota bacterium]